MLGSFIIILFIFLGGYAAGIAYLFLNFPNEIDLAANELEKTIPYYEVDGNAITSVFWDNVQPFLECCGVNGKISQFKNFMIFSVIQILREITFGESTSAKTAVFAIFEAFKACKNS